MSNRISRRSLLLSASAAAIAPHLPQQAQARSPNERLRLGFIGVGNQGFSNLALCQDEEVAALCDVDARYLNEASARFPAAAGFRDFREMLTSANLDAVVISSPDHTHALASLLAMQQGLHVYCEKPLSNNYDDCQVMAAAAKDSQVVTQFGVQHHAKRGYRRLRQILQAGELGQIKAIHAWSTAPFWPQGVSRPTGDYPVPEYLDWNLWISGAPMRPYAPGYHPLQWRGHWAFGSGALGDNGCHLLDPIVSGLPITAPTTIEVKTSGDGSNESPPSWSVVKYQVACTGAPAIPLTWYDGGQKPSAEVVGVRRVPDDGILIVAERSKVYAGKFGGMPQIVPGTAQDGFQLSPLTMEDPSNHHQQWLAAIRSGGPTDCPFSYGARLTSLCLLGNVAVRLNQRVTWNDAAQRFEDAPAADALLKTTQRQGWKFPQMH
ncbi:Gfo/Idh/MocA family protein [Blastopirellula retiformator]|uniref:Inositol 2-dehydrogenase n=1 Tax=Blastopirellula retiformator TaxID=2527970 RepID=A0A5C5UUG0_9BACT|nr:Gfo/Idh/MocA family oxidoreductase [Blastopirellula retiformator]TWT30064.1 Inositol 2-dehydrogenase [Blastopirellula retiformator]